MADNSKFNKPYIPAHRRISNKSSKSQTMSSKSSKSQTKSNKSSKSKTNSGPCKVLDFNKDIMAKAQALANKEIPLTDDERKSLEEVRRKNYSSTLSSFNLSLRDIPVNFTSNKRKSLADNSCYNSSLLSMESLSLNSKNPVNKNKNTSYEVDLNSTLDHTTVNLAALGKINEQATGERSTQMSMPSKKIKLSQKSSQKSSQKLDKADKITADLNKKLQTSKKENESLKKENQVLKQQSNKKDKIIENKERENQALTAGLKIEKTANAGLKKENSALKKENAALRKQLAQLTVAKDSGVDSSISKSRTIEKKPATETDTTASRSKSLEFQEYRKNFTKQFYAEYKVKQADKNNKEPEITKLKVILQKTPKNDHKKVFYEYASKLAKEKYNFRRLEKKIFDQIKAGLKKKDPKYKKIQATLKSIQDPLKRNEYMKGLVKSLVDKQLQKMKSSKK